jgi:hypothetical protein
MSEVFTSSTSGLSVDLAVSFEPEVFDFEVDPVAHEIELFELGLPRPPQGMWRERFDIRADVRFAYMDLKFDHVTVRVSAKSARLSSRCTGCSLLPHSQYGLDPLPARSVVDVTEKHTAQADASGVAQMHIKAGLLLGANARV